MRDEVFGGLRVRLTGGTDRQGGGDGPLLVLLHGYGAPGDDLVSLARVLDVPREVRFAFPVAPIDLGPQAAGGRAWWHIDLAAMQRDTQRGTPRDRSQEIPEGLAEARALVDETLTELQKALAPSHLVLGGFSQGAMLSCDVALRTERPLAALVLLSSTLLAEGEWAPLAPRRRGLPTVLSHGRSDPLLPFGAAERLRDLLTGAGLEVTWVPFRGQHEIPHAALDAVAKVVRRAVETPAAR